MAEKQEPSEETGTQCRSGTKDKPPTRYPSGRGVNSRDGGRKWVPPPLPAGIQSPGGPDMKDLRPFRGPASEPDFSFLTHTALSQTSGRVCVWGGLLGIQRYPVRAGAAAMW